MHILELLDDSSLELVQGGSLLGYTVGWVSHALYEYSKQESTIFMDRSLYPIT